MSRHFVAVGGSGQHVALALADFLVLAHSVTPDPLPPVDFLLLDSDPSSAQADALSAWQLAAEQMRAIAQAPDRAPGAPIDGWRSPLPSISEGVRTAREAIDDVLGIGAARLLLSDTQLEIPVTTGYHGEPRVAAILTDVLLARMRGGRLKEDDRLRRLQTAVGDADARICVTGSTIGGTGAGVLPRLIEDLATAGNRKAALCALVGLEWFKLDGDAENEERITANGIASLWHYVQNQARGSYRLVLWGHPSVGQARRERPFGSRSQGAKLDLTVPYYAVAAATAFLFGGETARERVAPVSTAGAFELTGELEFTDAIDLHWLMERNRDLLGRLQLMRPYIDQPYRGYVLPIFRRECTVQEIDGMSQPERESLARQIDAVMVAKNRALARFKEFAGRARVASPAPWKGVPILRSWVHGRKPSLSILPGQLQSVTRTVQTPSASRALPSDATTFTDFDHRPVGGRAPLMTTHVDGLANFARVDASRVPDGRGIDIVLRAVFENPATYWRVNGEPLSSMLLHVSTPALPPTLGAMGSDNYAPWVQRWFLLLGGICSGAAYVQRLDKPVLDITHAVMTSPGDGGADVSIGYLSSDTFCVPNLSSFWADPEAVRSLQARIGSLRAHTAAWLRTLVHAGECRFGEGSRPRWAQLLEEAFGDDIPSDVAADPHRTAQVRWGNADREITVPLPRSDRRPGEPLADAMARAFAVPVQYLEVPDPDFTPAETAAWRDLTEHKHLVSLVRDENQEWHQLDQTPVVWADRLRPETQAALSGNIYFHPGRGYAWKMGAGALALTFQDVLTSAVMVLNPEISGAVASWPIRSRFAGLVRSCQTEVLTDGSVSAEIDLLGRDSVRHVYPPSQVRRFQRLTVFSWPKVTGAGNGSHCLLFTSETLSFRYRVLYGMSIESLAAVSATQSNAHYPLYLTPQSEGVAPSDQPIAMTVAVTNAEELTEDVGLLPYRVVTKAPSVGAENWAVDLGTSSTVIVRRDGNEHEGTIVYPTEDRDSTNVYSMGEGVSRKMLLWYPTWDEKRPYTSHTSLMPSQVIDYAALGRPQVPRDLERRVYGRDFALDHGEEIASGYDKAIIDDLKWRRDEKQIYRRFFLEHLLEQSISMEMSARQARTFPRAIDVTFTLPLRQRDDIARFAREITDVAQVVRNRTGIDVRPKFQWESVAIAPTHLGKDDGIIVVADLGGGTLDLYAARFIEGGKKHEAVDSAYLGGHECARLLYKRRAFGDGTFSEYLRNLRKGAFEKKDIASRVPESREYFELLYRYIVLWTSALRARWKVDDAVPTDLQLAGLGWSLPGCPSRQSEVAARLTGTAKQLALGFLFQPFGAESAEVEGRKLRLAKNCANVPGVSASEIVAAVENIDMVLGLDVIENGKPYSASDAMRDVGTIRGAAIRAAERSAARLVPGVSQTDLAELARRLSTSADPTDRKRGAIDPQTGTLGISPLTSLAEIAIANLVVAP